MSSSSNVDRSFQKKAKELIKRKATFKIREEIISKQFILRAIKSCVEKDDDLSQDILVKSPLGDSMVMTITKGDQHITISTKYENDIELDIKGDSDLLQKFIHDVTLEAVVSVAGEFTGCLIKSKKPDFSIETFRKNLEKNMHVALHKAVEESLED